MQVQGHGTGPCSQFALVIVQGQRIEWTPTVAVQNCTVICNDNHCAVPTRQSLCGAVIVGVQPCTLDRKGDFAGKANEEMQRAGRAHETSTT